MSVSICGPGDEFTEQIIEMLDLKDKKLTELRINLKVGEATRIETTELVDNKVCGKVHHENTWHLVPAELTKVTKIKPGEDTTTIQNKLFRTQAPPANKPNLGHGITLTGSETGHGINVLKPVERLKPVEPPVSPSKHNLYTRVGLWAFSVLFKLTFAGAAGGFIAAAGYYIARYFQV